MKMQMNLEILKEMIDDLAQKKWSCSTQLFPREFCSELAHECQRLFDEGQLKKAAIGFGSEKSVHQEIRGDFTAWIESDTTSPAPAQLRLFLQELQDYLNQELYLGLRRFETHFALYPPGSGYQKHIDNPKGQGHRRITFILYLNENWQGADGGELSIYNPQNLVEKIAQVSPALGTTVFFCSDVFPHQVQTSTAPRKSVTGWLRNDAL